MAKKQNIKAPKVEVKGTASVHAPGVEQALHLRAEGLDYTDAVRERESARNAELLRAAAERLMNAGGPDALRAELDKLAKDLGVK
jgi:hypothetical protein